MKISMESYCKIAAAVFAAGAVAQFLRAIIGFNMMAGSMLVPVGISWVAAIVLAGLAWLGFTATRS
jgi:hypothetical protein